MATRVRIRGIYTTALTRLLLLKGYLISQPSQAVQQRLGLERNQEEYDIHIDDNRNRQGLEIHGDTEKVTELIGILQKELFDAVISHCRSEVESDGIVHARLELPGLSKENLDRVRSAVQPTLQRHHRFRLIDSKRLEAAEEQLDRFPEMKEVFERDLFQELILAPIRNIRSLRIEHAKVSSRPIRPREGVLFDQDAHGFVLKRVFTHGGLYDGLDVPIEEGDFCLTEVRDGFWYVRHLYYSKANDLKGEYFNINTPVELYPYGARYVDLEVDVIRRAGEDPFIIDQERLAILVKEGMIGNWLQSKAMEVAESLKESRRVESVAGPSS